MLKHVHVVPPRSQCSTPIGSYIMRHRDDTMSINSTMSYGSLSPENTLSSRSSSYTSLTGDSSPQPVQMATMKIYAKCLRPDIEYKTLSISYQTTCRELIHTLLSKYKMKHRDPNLFYLTMEVLIRKTGVPIRTLMVLDDEACPAELQSCHPRGESKFALQMRRGGLVKVHDACLMPGSQYKSLLISEKTTVDELIQLLLNCYNIKEPLSRFSIHEAMQNRGLERKLHPDDCPLSVVQNCPEPRTTALVIRRNPEPPPRRKLLWSKSLELSMSRSSDRSETSSPSSPVKTPSSYRNYENYFYI